MKVELRQIAERRHQHMKRRRRMCSLSCANAYSYRAVGEGIFALKVLRLVILQEGSQIAVEKLVEKENGVL